MTIKTVENVNLLKQQIIDGKEMMCKNIMEMLEHKIRIIV